MDRLYLGLELCCPGEHIYGKYFSDDITDSFFQSPQFKGLSVYFANSTLRITC